jgi:uncharacterized protein YdhG (YjbR/CyaY superfamily)
MSEIRPGTVDEYIEAAPEAGREKLREMRAILQEVAPNAAEALKWGSPVFEDGRILFAYSAHTSHLNFMPTGPTASFEIMQRFVETA